MGITKKETPAANGSEPGNMPNIVYGLSESELLPMLVEALGARRLSDGSAMVHCPAHDDQTPSLHVTPADDGKILVYCLADCPPDAVIDALKARGLWPRKNGSRSINLPPGSPKRLHGAEYTAHWTYHDQSGNVLFYTAFLSL